MAVVPISLWASTTTLHLLRRRVELDEIGVVAVLGRADVEPAVVAFDDRKVAAALIGGFFGDGVGGCHEPGGGRWFDGDVPACRGG